MFFNHQALRFDNPNAPYGRAQKFQPWKFKLQPLEDDEPPEQQQPAAQDNLEEEQDKAAPEVQEEQLVALNDQRRQELAAGTNNKRVRFALVSPPQQEETKDTGSDEEGIQKQGETDQQEASPNQQAERPEEEDPITPPVYDDDEEKEEEEPLSPLNDDVEKGAHKGIQYETPLQGVKTPESSKDHKLSPPSPLVQQEAVPIPKLQQDEKDPGEDAVKQDQSFHESWGTTGNLLEPGEQAWQASFRKLQQFKKDHGHVLVPKRYPTDQKFATWLQNQRCQSLNENCLKKLKCTATRERRRQQLQSLGVVFPNVEATGRGQIKEEDWQAKFGELESFKKDHGHVQIPQEYPTNQKLATWLQNQRYQSLNENSSAKLKCAATRERRRQQLQSLGVAFPDVQQQGKPDQREASPNQEVRRPEEDPIMPPIHDDDHEEQPLAPLVDDEEGTHKDIQCEIPLQGEEAREFPSPPVQQEAVPSPKLQQDEKEPGEDGVEQDQSFGESSSTANLAERNEQGWQASFRKLQQFKKDHGHVLLPKKCPTNQNLSNWLQNQRCQSLNENCLKKLKCPATRERRRQQLQSLGVTFPAEQQLVHESEEDIWEGRFVDLECYQEDYGHVIVPTFSSEYPELARWLMKQRFWYLSDRKLAAQPTEQLLTRRTRLEGLGVTFPASTEPNTVIGHKRTASEI